MSTVTRLKTVIVLFIASAALGALPNISRAEWQAVLITLSQTGVGLGALIFGIYLARNQAKTAQLRLSTYFYTLALVAIFTGSGWASWQGEASVRIQLFYGNPNLLAASLCMLALIVLSLSRSRSHLLVLPLSFMALFTTGSRIGLTAFALAFLVWLVVAASSRRRHLLVSLLICGLIATISWLGRAYIVPIDNMINSQNILKDSSDLSARFWLEYARNRSLQIDSDIGDAPDDRSKSDRLRVQAGENATLVLYQNVETARLDTPYIGSVYLRADAPQDVVLSTNLKKVTCRVTQVWQRCVTPVGLGNGKGGVQLRLETATKGASLNVYVWGAQLERDTTVTELAPKFSIPTRYYMLKRFSIGNLASDTVSVAGRYQAISTAWQVFLKNPLLGVGDAALRISLTQTVIPLSHAHNLFVQQLASTGVLGLLALFTPLVGVLVILWRERWRVLLPLVIALAALNLTDISYFSAGVYYPFWLTLGLFFVHPPLETVNA